MRAFCPGHITGFFTVDDSNPDILRRGSRGVGFCVNAGATANVRAEKNDVTEISVHINGEKSDAPVTRRGIEFILREKCAHVTVEIKLGAPQKQGFGMSAAGTFAACLALAESLGLDNVHEKALEATHRAEVQMRTGLGDAVAQSIGGAVVRETPGIGAFGRVRNIPAPYREVCVCIMGEGVSTEKIITSEEMKKVISAAGNKCLADFTNEPNFDVFLDLSRRFAFETDLASEKMKALLDTISGKGSMVMLGNAVFAFGDADALEKEMGAFGNVIRTEISHAGAGLIL
jgi:pantoate kinase